MTQPEPGNWHHQSPVPSSPATRPDEPLPASRQRPGSRIWLIATLSAIAVLMVGLVVWLLVAAALEALKSPPGDAPAPGSVVTTTAAPPSALPLPREAAPVDFRLGDCFSDFRPESERSVIVACDSPHSAQFVANYTYESGEAYPGADALKAKALEACQAVTLSPAAGQYALNFERVFPTNSSWDAGDRRVDCFVVAPEGNILGTSVLP